MSFKCYSAGNDDHQSTALVRVPHKWEIYGQPSFLSIFRNDSGSGFKCCIAIFFFFVCKAIAVTLL